MNFEREAREATFDFPLAAQETIEALKDQHARALTDYETWKRDLLEWVHFEGTDPNRLRRCFSPCVFVSSSQSPTTNAETIQGVP